MSWSQGYVADIAYTANFYRETAPNHIAFAALSVGRSPGRAFRPNRMLELGFGQGFGLSLLAAANPDVQFEGHDFNPEHVAHARRLIATAKLDNITVTESSFEEAAERGGADDVDVIALHGIYSWVSRGAQDAIVSVIRQRLQPDGMLYVSYNCMPGWAPIAPIRALMVEVKRRNAGRSERQLALALDIVKKLKQGGAGYFAVNPAAAQHVDQMLTLDRVYLAHEYLDEHWELIHFSDLAQRMSAAKLTYLASATLLENLDQYAVPPELMPLMRETDDPIMRETLRDYAGNRRFRRDLFTRGLATLTGPEMRRRLSDLGFALTVPRKQAIYSLPGPLMQLNVRPEFYDPVYDRLAEKPASFDELAALPVYGEDKIGQLLECLCLLVSSGQVAPVIAAERIDQEPARRFNRMIVDFARTGRNYGALAAPLIRSGLAAGDLALLALAAVFDGKGDDPETAAKHAMSILKVLGRRPFKDGTVINDEIAAVDFLASAYRPILEENVPLWRQLGML
jgi:predicted O-methyltransferase YrrM